MNIRKWMKVVLMLGLSVAAGIIYMQGNVKMEIKDVTRHAPKVTEDGMLFTMSEEKASSSKIPTRKEPAQDNGTVSEVEVRLKQLRQNMLNTCSRLGLNKTFTGEEVYSRNPYLEKSLFFSDKSKFLFCLIPKCATRSQAAFLASVEGILPENEASKSAGYKLIETLTTRRSTLQENGKRIEQYTKVAIAREPFSRLLSAYRDKIEKGGRGDYYKAIHRAIKSRHGNTTDEDRVTFEQFVSFLTQPKEAQTDPHWNYYLRLCAPCEMNYDYIIHMDTVEEDIEFIAKKFGIKNFSFPPSFNSFTDFQKVVDYYGKVSPQFVNDLYHRYKMDYDIFGFPPPPQF